MINFNTKEQVKEYAKKLLENTDYSVLPDISLTNKDEFVQYRNIVRFFYFNPTVGATFPEEPKPIWGNSINSLNKTTTQPNTDIPTE
jgi:hypothetical protein